MGLSFDGDENSLMALRNPVIICVLPARVNQGPAAVNLALIPVSGNTCHGNRRGFLSSSGSRKEGGRGGKGGLSFPSSRFLDISIADVYYLNDQSVTLEDRMPRHKANEREDIKASTQSAIIGAAIREFCQKGFETATIDDIAAVAGCAKGTVYNYFSDKAALYRAAISDVATFHAQALERAVLAERGAEARLEAFFRSGFAFVDENPERAGLAIAALHGPRLDFKEALGGAYLPLFSFVAQEIVSRGVAEGRFADCKPMEAASILMTLYLGCASGPGKDGKVAMDPALPFAFALRALENR
jgi:AcrR family transcriptional regulator